jgi:hypothetical protein
MKFTSNLAGIIIRKILLSYKFFVPQYFISYICYIMLNKRKNDINLKRWER